MTLESQVYEATRADLAGENGAAARAKLLGELKAMRTRQALGRLRVFGAGTARVLHVGNTVHVSGIEEEVATP